MNRIEYNVTTGELKTIQLTQAEIDALPVPTAQEIKQALEQSVQDNMEEAAKSVGYDSLLSACSYAAVPNPFQAESQSFLKWRADCWTYCYQVQAAVVAGTQPMPTKEQLIAGLPVRV